MPSYVGHALDDACWGESIRLSLSFEQNFSAGEHVTAVEPWQIAVAEDSPDPDAAPAALIDGPATFDALRSFQRLTFPDGRSTRTRYQVYARVRTNFDNEVVLSSVIFVKPLRLADDQFRKVYFGASLIHTFDFSRDLSPGEKILAADWDIAVEADSPNLDPAAASRLVGAPVNGIIETHHRLAFADDIAEPVLYLVRATVSTTSGNVFRLFSRLANAEIASYVGHDLDDACWGESILFSLAFDQDVSGGEHIVSVQDWQARRDGVVDTEIVTGAATFDGVRSFQRLAFPDGRSLYQRYQLTASVVTNFGNEIALLTNILVKPLRLADVQFRKTYLGSSLIHTFDFSRDLSPGEKILGAVWGMDVEADSPNADAAVASRLVGNPVNGFLETHHRLTFGNDIEAPVDYLVRATVNTTFDNVMRLFSRERALPSPLPALADVSRPTFYWLGF